MTGRPAGARAALRSKLPVTLRPQGLLGFRRSTAPVGEKQRLLIVGGGMTALRLCEHLVDQGGTKQYSIRVFGEEPHVAYDRVNLSRVVKGEEVTALALRDASWCEERDIEWLTGDKVLEIDRTERSIRTTRGTHTYDKLVLATGARPVVPKLEGIHDPRVTAYRTAEDAQRIRQLAETCKTSPHPAVVVGGGLLGLEAADALSELGCSVRVIEAAKHMIPRQLDEEAATHLHESMRGRGLALSFGARIQSLSPEPAGLRLQTTADEFLDAAFVVLAIGVHPRDELARASGLKCDLFGGVEVSDHLVTSDPRIFALGECVRHRGLSYGLVAPGYEMADCLASRLVGEKSTFKGASLATRLKVKGIELSVLGESNVKDLATKHYVHKHEGSFRKLVVHRGRLIGATSLGTWNELVNAQQAIARKERLTATQCRAFEGGKATWKSTRLDITSWPESATVCQCTGVNCGALKKARQAGACTSDALAKKTGAGSVCGTCLPLLQTLCGESQTASTSKRKAVWLAAVATLLLLPALFALAPVPFSQTVQQSIAIDALWRNPVLKQLSGFSLFALTAAAAALGLRKRWPRLNKLGSYISWQTTHALIGVGCIGGFVIHTGVRLGNNLDAVLGSVFIVTLTLGGIAGVLLSRRSEQPTERRTRHLKNATNWHLWLQWPLPLLIVAHVVKVYFF